MWFRRQELHRKGYLRAADLANCADGAWVKTAGLAFVKQRPGTASGVVFIGVADETGDFRIFVAPDFFEQNRRVIQQAKFIGVEGPIQKEGPIIHVMARSIYELSVEGPAGRLKVESHDFH
jgi:error-prone DNA polymerase